MAVEKKFVEDGYVKASLDEYFANQLSRAGYGGMEINRTPMGTQIVVYSEKPGMVIGKAGKVIRRLTRDVGRLYNLDNPQIDAQEVKRPELNAQMMATRLASSIERGWYFRKAGHNAMRAIMNSGALGCEIILSGKVTGARSRVEKMVNGYIKHAGKPVDDIVDEGFAVAVKKLGTIGCKVRIIHPGAVLPDSYHLKEIVEEAVAEVAPEEAESAGVEELVEAEATGEVAEAEDVESTEEATEAKVTEEVPEAEPEVKAESEEVESTEGSEENVSEPEDEQLPGEQRRLVEGVWQHKHEGHDYWHPMARVHRGDN
ncbi:SSU ribosomal protein S3P [Methanohalophilus euhalobius]|jgi:small subunit ribosomal protein S3|uniref:Small ribosomal subunit protein uS3 n=1 Tax=Methanohalophilus euhalobius TaxID=51203 RepID=A0A285EXJ1_9EURY|nr:MULTISPECIES: 30S ribosomal protein S3 [Methanohalophilus]ODV50559.1 MAG: small subunit ribosomal protein S3 [Methanohalophilus sp. 2-GBenrich]RSD36004.1 MAG: small subunit ribosomal protein S3 [Methanohalophilus sp.]TCL12722.1 SSU ribosomal protein S3P [Methanohalophilus euhalobius]SNY03762.1 SSU ribosomal protein S3P [Methanohalophilus euhalobius]